MLKHSRRKFMSYAGKLAVTAGFTTFAANTSRAMPATDFFIHHVYFYLKEPNNAQHEAKLLEGLHKLAKVPTIQYVHIGKPAETNRSVIVKDYTFSWMCFFKNIIEEEIYQTHPIHLDFIKEYSSLWEKVIVYDSVGPKKIG